MKQLQFANKNELEDNFKNLVSSYTHILMYSI